jgi:hypothetical protein
MVCCQDPVENIRNPLDGYANNIHIVTHGKAGSLKCDPACVNSSTNICEHVLAVAQVRGSLNEFLAWYRSKRRADPKEGIKTKCWTWH